MLCTLEEGEDYGQTDAIGLVDLEHSDQAVNRGLGATNTRRLPGGMAGIISARERMDSTESPDDSTAVESAIPEHGPATTDLLLTPNGIA
jgi:hypothetical protein